MDVIIDPPDGNNIVLIGFMGAGKTTIGKELARFAGLRFVDLDEQIIQARGHSIAAIFAEQGEEAFRGYETEALRNLAGIAPSVIATGGGIVGREENWSLLRRLGPVVYLNASWETLRPRLAVSKGRPLAGAGGDWEKVWQLWRKRLPLYDQADFIIDVDGHTPDEVARQILVQLQGEQRWKK